MEKSIAPFFRKKGKWVPFGSRGSPESQLIYDTQSLSRVSHSPK